MKKRKLFIMVSAIVLVILQGCVSKEEAGEEFIQYFNIDSRTELSDRMNEKTYKLFDLEDENAEEYFQQYLNEEVIPEFKDRIDYLENLHYQSRTVRKLKELDIKINKRAYARFEDIEKALENGNTIDEVRDEFKIRDQETQVLSNRYFDKRDKLIEKYDLVSYREDGEDMLKKKD